MRFELMTPEERFRVITNLLKYAAGLRTQHAEDMSKLRERNEELQELQRSVFVTIDKLAEAQRVTDEKLHALIETVDRIIRERGTPPS
jgi:uncharacterized Zn finger protein (UPF0148 family)